MRMSPDLNRVMKFGQVLEIVVEGGSCCCRKT